MTLRASTNPGAIFSACVELRAELDEARAQIVVLTTERDALRKTLIGEAVIADTEREVPERKGSAWWMSAWREVSRHRTELAHRVQQLEAWLLESGREASRLQTELDGLRDQNGGLARLLDEVDGDVEAATQARDQALEQLARCGCDDHEAVH